MRRRTSSRGRAFSLIEASVVVVLLGILAASAVPAFRSMDRTHEASAVAEIERALVLARATAMATGVPTGVLFGTDRGMIHVVQVSQSGRGTEPLTDVFGSDRLPVVIAALGGGVAIEPPTIEGRRTSIDTIWFDHRGRPEERGRDASLVGAVEQNVVIRIGTEGVLRVHARSGLVERAS